MEAIDARSAPTVELTDEEQAACEEKEEAAVEIPEDFVYDDEDESLRNPYADDELSRMCT
jgi:hypothetical protein